MKLSLFLLYILTIFSLESNATPVGPNRESSIRNNKESPSNQVASHPISISSTPSSSPPPSRVPFPRIARTLSQPCSTTAEEEECIISDDELEENSLLSVSSTSSKDLVHSQQQQRQPNSWSRLSILPWFGWIDEKKPKETTEPTTSQVNEVQQTQDNGSSTSTSSGNKENQEIIRDITLPETKDNVVMVPYWLKDLLENPLKASILLRYEKALNFLSKNKARLAQLTRHIYFRAFEKLKNRLIGFTAIPIRTTFYTFPLLNLDLRPLPADSRISETTPQWIQQLESKTIHSQVLNDIENVFIFFSSHNATRLEQLTVYVYIDCLRKMDATLAAERSASDFLTSLINFSKEISETIEKESKLKSS